MDLDRFTNYYSKKMKNNLTKKKRIKTISDFFSKQTKKDISFSDEKESLAYIIQYIIEREDESEEILEELYTLLEYSYSTQNPNYVYEFKTQYTDNTLYDLVKKTFKKRLIYGDFEYELTDSIKFDSYSRIIECNLEYQEYSSDIVTGEEYKKSSGLVNIIFDMKNNKFFSSKSPNYKTHNNLVEFLSSKGFNISSIYILKRALTIKNRNFTEFSPTTLLIINLLYEKIPELGYEITLEAISFTNLDSQNVQGMKMKGTDLLEAQEILQRIHSGDEVHNLKLSLQIIDKSSGIDKYVGTTFMIDLQGKIAFIFEEDDDVRESRKREICINLQNSLMELIYDEDTIERGQNIIYKELPKPKSIQFVVSEIKKSVLELIKNSDDKIEVEKFFIENYPTSSNDK
ncbi:hypothetical protein [Sutcliffiella sp. NC1]|uniref:hypothetical protein n=1 Tax=Sutcliffiella sp. NC1 TaxID=3004096 RepID=UPI0022DD3E90|nr:hypothetical protein [Sutcliffiella sp. NC1]WBL16867.1 hypothetical protein O1A01_09620 [Sutcliffiella sp. NC1]